MVHVVATIAPIFVIIFPGWFLRAKKFLPQDLFHFLNRLVFYLAIPAMIFREVAMASVEAKFQLPSLIATMAPGMVVLILSLAASIFLSLTSAQRGTFMQSSFHGNLGYIGLADCYYSLGSEGFAQASILAGFLIVWQNVLSVLGYQPWSSTPG